MKENFRKIPNWIKLAVILILMVIIGYGIWFFASKPPLKPPLEFLEARQQGAEISQKIVELTTDTNQKIKEINSFDFSGDYNKALILIDEAKNKNSEANSQAIKLADEMRKMAESLNKISAVKSRQLAIEAISSEMSLIANFIDYTATLDRFLNNLRLAIATSNIKYRRLAEENLSEINDKTLKINSSNQEFLDKIKDFDKSF